MREHGRDPHRRGHDLEAPQRRGDELEGEERLAQEERLRRRADPAGAQGPKGDKGDKGDVGDASLVAFANVNGTGASPSIRSFGGHGTTGASVIACGTGCFDVTFTGSFPGATSKDKIASFATADTDNYDLASTSLNASPVPTTSSITIRCWTMSFAGGAAVVNRDFAVQILVS